MMLQLNFRYLKRMLLGAALAIILLLVFACSDAASDGAGKVEGDLQVLDDVERALAAVSELDPWERPGEILQGLSKDDRNQLAKALYELRTREPAPLTLAEMTILSSVKKSVLGIPPDGYLYVSIGVRPDGSLVTEDDWDDFERMMLWHRTRPEQREELGLPDKITEIYAMYNLLVGQEENALEILAANKQLAEAIRTYVEDMIEPSVWPSEKGVDSND